MNFSLPPHLQSLIRQKVESGFYDSYNQVVEEALSLLIERDQMLSMRRDGLLKEIAKGVYQADNRQLVGSPEVFRSLRKKPSSTEV